jgi:hypothetical protein
VYPRNARRPAAYGSHMRLVTAAVLGFSTLGIALTLVVRDARA